MRTVTPVRAYSARQAAKMKKKSAIILKCYNKESMRLFSAPREMKNPSHRHVKTYKTTNSRSSKLVCSRMNAVVMNRCRTGTISTLNLKLEYPSRTIF